MAVSPHAFDLTLHRPSYEATLFKNSMGSCLAYQVTPSTRWLHSMDPCGHTFLARAPCMDCIKSGESTLAIFQLCSPPYNNSSVLVTVESTLISCYPDDFLSRH